MQVSSSIVYASRAEQFVRAPRPASASRACRSLPAHPVSPVSPKPNAHPRSSHARPSIEATASTTATPTDMPTATTTATTTGVDAAPAARRGSPLRPRRPRRANRANRANRADRADRARRADHARRADRALAFAGAEPDAGTFTYRAPTVSTPASNPPAASPSPTTSVVTALTNAFPLWVLLGAIVGLTAPRCDVVQGRVHNRRARRHDAGHGPHPRARRVPRRGVQTLAGGWRGAGAQYTIMPIPDSLWSRRRALRGVRRGSHPRRVLRRGTASNLVTYLGRANVALSVVLTTASTFLAAFMTPFMTKTPRARRCPDAAGLSWRVCSSLCSFPYSAG